MFAQKQKLRCSAACCFPRSLAAALAAQLVLTYCQTRLCDPILSFKKSNIVQQKHYFSIRIGFMIKGLFLSHSWVWCPSFLGAILHFQSSNIWRFILKTGIHCQKESCLNSAENESWPGGEIRAELHMVMVLVVLGLHHTNPRSQVSTYLETTCN